MNNYYILRAFVDSRDGNVSRIMSHFSKRAISIESIASASLDDNLVDISLAFYSTKEVADLISLQVKKICEVKKFSITSVKHKANATYLIEMSNPIEEFSCFLIACINDSYFYNVCLNEDNLASFKMKYDIIKIEKICENMMEDMYE
jgi:acetolactate synthase small subunit